MNNKYIGEVKVDIENAKTQKVERITLPILEYVEDDKFVFDITNLNEKELKMLEEAIDSSLTYTDIELFYVSMEDGMFNYGDDFEYVIEDGKLKGKYIREEIEKKIKGGIL